MKLSLTILSTTLFLVFLSYPVDAGTTFTQLSKSVEIVDLDKWIKERDKALEYARKQGAMVFTHSEVVE